MADTKDQIIRDEILNEDLTKQIIAELGLVQESPEAQAEILDMMSENIMQRFVIEVLKILPEEKHAEFSAFIGSGTLIGLRDFLVPYIPDLDQFIQHHSAREFEATKARMRMIEEGVEEDV